MSSNVRVALGGAKSGKTAHALRLATELWRKNPQARLNYVACASVHDDEMAAKIRAHQTERGDLPWRTLEEPYAIPSLFDDFHLDDIVVLDSLGMWISQLLLKNSTIPDEIASLQQALEKCSAKVIIVADEVGFGLIPEHKLGRQFREANGACNQQICALAKHVDFVIAGLVQRLK